MIVFLTAGVQAGADGANRPDHAGDCHHDPDLGTGNYNMANSIKIIHKVTKGAAYRFLADYFRLAGFFVRDCAGQRIYGDDNYDAVIVIRTGFTQDELDGLQQDYQHKPLVQMEEMFSWKEFVQERSSNDADGQDMKKPYYDYQKDYLRCVLDLLQSPLGLAAERDVFDTLSDIYVDDSLMKYRIAYTFFYDDVEVVQIAQRHISNAFVEFCDRVSTESKFAIYIYINLAYMMNETCRFLKHRFVCNTQKCIDRLDEILTMDPTFYNAYVMKGFLAENDPALDYQAGEYYELALEWEGETPYMAYTSYRLGRVYEKILRQPDKAEENYRRALKLSPYEYRAYYKLLLIEKKRGNYIKAIDYAKRILSILREKEEANYLQPKEYEYLFKAYLEMAKLYGKELVNGKDYEWATERLHKLCGSIRGGNVMWDMIFDNSKYSDEYKEKLFKMLSETASNCRRYY